MSAPYKKVILFGATSGIGLALAEKYAETGTHVVAVGRRQKQLDELANKHKGMISTKVCDIAQLNKIPGFVEEVIAEHPDLECVFLNRTKYFLPFLLKKKSSIMYTTSGLALVPIARCPNYNATKAALHQFIMSIRRQLQGSSVKVIELFPPAVQTELHDAKHQPTIENGGQIGITMDEFMETAWAGIVEGKEEIPVGFVITALEKIDGPRKAMMAHMPWDPSEFERK